MSKWTIQFETHSFRQVWIELKANLESSKIDDETVLTSVEELARLRKVISYLDAIIESLDPELIPLSTWENFENQARSCSAEINNYNGNKVVKHLANANNHADNLLTYVRPYMVLESGIEDALRNSLKAYAATVDQYLEEFRSKAKEFVSKISSNAKQAERIAGEIAGTQQKIDNYRAEIFEDSGESKGIKSQIDDLAENALEKYEEINDFHNQTLVGDETDKSTKELILDAGRLIDQEKERITALLVSTESKVAELETFHKKAFGVMADDGEVPSGLSKDLDELLARMRDFEDTQHRKYTALNEQIEELLPGATSAGLASAYSEMKHSFAGAINRFSWLFYFCVAGLVAFSIATSTRMTAPWTFEFVTPEDWLSVLKGFVNRLPFYVPVVWLAFFATRRRSECQRLQQEYAHKESLAKSYHSYKRQLIELDAKDQTLQKELIKHSIEAIAYNASGTLDGKHGDKMPSQEVIEKIIASAIKAKGTV